MFTIMSGFFSSFSGEPSSRSRARPNRARTRLIPDDCGDDGGACVFSPCRWRRGNRRAPAPCRTFGQRRGPLLAGPPDPSGQGSRLRPVSEEDAGGGAVQSMSTGEEPNATGAGAICIVYANAWSNALKLSRMTSYFWPALGAGIFFPWQPRNRRKVLAPHART